MLDKEKISRNFSRSASSYDQHALLQKELADKLFDSIGGFKPARVLDIGCGTGYLADKMSQKFPSAKVVGIDIAPGMIEVAKSKYQRANLLFALGDGESLPFDQQSFDLIISNASLQWMSLEKVLGEVNRVIRQQGNFSFTTFGPGTLIELKACDFQVNDFTSIAEIKKGLGKIFSEIKIDAYMKKVEFASVKELILHLKEIGAHSSEKVPKKFDVFRAMKEHHRRFSKDGTINASFEVIFAVCKYL